MLVEIDALHCTSIGEMVCRDREDVITRSWMAIKQDEEPLSIAKKTQQWFTLSEGVPMFASACNHGFTILMLLVPPIVTIMLNFFIWRGGGLGSNAYSLAYFLLLSDGLDDVLGLDSFGLMSL